MNTWEIGKQIEKIMDEGAKAAEREIEQAARLERGKSAIAEELLDVNSITYHHSFEEQKAAWDKLINWKGVIIR
jgi:hypothetical protein